MNNPNLSPPSRAGSPARAGRTAVVVVLISFFIGGISGGIAGYAAALFSTSSIFNFLPSPLRVSRSTILQESAQVRNEGGALPLSGADLSEEDATTEVVKRASPAVVSIIVTKDLSKVYSNTPFSSPFNDFFFQFPGFQFNLPQFQQQAPQGKQEVGGGTGFVVSSDGLILTNKHVVDDTEAEYTVLMNDGKRYTATVLARDPVLDLAVVKIDMRNLTPLSLGDSDSVKIGETVIAIGNALGEFRNTVTKGVVSGIGRTVTASGTADGSEVIEGAIQTDAAINPGNSGGPLLNLQGEVIGVNTAMSQAGQLIGFALPINEAKRVIDSVEKYGKIIRPYVGVRYVMINEEIAKANQLPVQEGALITRGEQRTDLAIMPGSPADKAGLVENDIILELDGQKVDKDNSLARLIAEHSPGDTVTLKILHKGEEKEVRVKLEQFKEQ
ncbi:MAG: trypsin-like peptidase domain-containing protein [Patescibacteria group bacterium]